MSLYRWRAILPFTILLTLLLAACAGSSTSQAPATPTPAPRQWQELLTKVGKNLNAAKTLDGILDVTVVGLRVNGMVNAEVCHEPPAKRGVGVPRFPLTHRSVGAAIAGDGNQDRQYG